MIQITNSLIAVEVPNGAEDFSIQREHGDIFLIFYKDMWKNYEKLTSGNTYEYICLASELLDVNTEINMMYQESTELIVAMMEKVDLTKDYALIRITN